MSTLELLEALIEHLRPKFTDFDVCLMPNLPSHYYLSHPLGAIILSYGGSSFDMPRPSDAMVQQRILRLHVNLICRNLHDASGAIVTLDALRSALIGLEIKPFSPCYLIEEQFDGNDEERGIWNYGLTFATATLELEQLHNPTCEGSLLVKVPYRNTNHHHKEII